MATRGRIHVLHVDDEPGFSNLAADCLESENEWLTVQTATSPAAALDRLAETTVDCVVSDYQMPEMDGLAFFERVREDHPDLPFVLFTGKGSEEIASEALRAGVSDYLQKETGPDQFAVLANRIENVVTRRRAEREVEMTRRRFQRLVEETTDAIFVVDGSGEFQYVTPSVEHILGYTPDDLVGQSGFEDVHPDDVDAAMAEFTALLERADGRASIEFRYQHADGSWVWLEARGRNLLDDEAIEGVVVYTRDITDRKKREERLRTVFDHSPDAIFVSDGDRVTEVNPTACERLGYTREELVGRPVPEFIVELEMPSGATEWRPDEVTDAGGSLTIEAEHRRADGSTYPVEVNVSTIEWDGQEQYLAIARDVGDRRERERRLEAFHRATQDLLQVDTREEAADLAVRKVKEILGLPMTGIWLYDEERDALVPSGLSEEATDLLADVPTYTQGEGLSWEVFESGEKRVYDDLWEVDGAANPETPIRSEIILPLGDHGVLNTGATEPGMLDESDARLAELWAATLTLVFTRLDREQRLRDRERELSHERDRLAEFASVVSHDLRNPLNVAQGHLHRVGDADDDALAAVDRALDRMERLVEELLVLARQGETVDDPEPVDLREIVRASWATVETADTDLDVRAAATLLADFDRLAQVFENLFRNAVEHGDADRIEVGTIDDDTGFYVADDGTGVLPEARDSIFQAGYTTADESTGLGLKIVRDVVTAHGWEVGVTDSDAGGVRVEVTGLDIVADGRADC